jgi:purine-binding chemotaxis protein CheW
MEFGVLADIIIGTQNILIENIHPLPDSTTGIGAEYLKGVTNEHIVILNAAKILGDEKIIIHQIIE